MSSTLTEALASPGDIHDVECPLACRTCRTLTPTTIHGVAVMSEHLDPLGSLRCAGCGGHDLEFLPDDRNAIVATLNRMLQSPKRLPHGTQAFFRGGDFQAFGKAWRGPRELRAATAQYVAANPDDAVTHIQAIAALVNLRDFDRALEMARAVHGMAPDSPEPLALAAEIAFNMGHDEDAREFARKALERREGKLLVMKNRRAIADEMARILAPRGPDATALAKVGRNDPCPCGSGKKYKKCCGA